MKKTEVEAIARGLAPILKEQLAGLEARLKALEDRPELKYCGIFKEGQHYQAGSLITRGGSLWLAEFGTSNYPGGRDSGWRLVSKGS